MKTKVVLLSLFVALIACNDESSPANDLIDLAPKVVQTLELLDSFGQPVAIFGQGETITFALSAKNTSNETASLGFASSHQTDFYVRDANDSSVTLWDRNHDSVYAQVLTNINLMPLETKVFEESWNQVKLDGLMLPPGRYIAEATFVEEFDESVTVEFEVQ